MTVAAPFPLLPAALQAAPGVPGPPVANFLAALAAAGVTAPDAVDEEKALMPAAMPALTDTEADAPSGPAGARRNQPEERGAAEPLGAPVWTVVAPVPVAALVVPVTVEPAVAVSAPAVRTPEAIEPAPSVSSLEIGAPAVSVPRTAATTTAPLVSDLPASPPPHPEAAQDPVANESAGPAAPVPASAPAAERPARAEGTVPGRAAVAGPSALPQKRAAAGSAEAPAAEEPTKPPRPRAHSVGEAAPGAWADEVPMPRARVVADTQREPRPEAHFVKLLANLERPPDPLPEVERENVAVAVAPRAAVVAAKVEVPMPARGSADGEAVDPAAPVAREGRGGPAPRAQLAFGARPAPEPRAQLAFGARLAPAAPAHAVKPAEGAAYPPAKPTEENAPSAEAAAAKPRRDAPPAEEERSRGPRPEDAARELAAEGPDAPPAGEPGIRAMAAAVRPERAAALDSKSAEEIEAPRPTAPVLLSPAKPHGVAAREIRIELAGGDSKVEVRLVERPGGVHFGVRTPDDRLASTLRENLPALSSRLEQSGFRADQWHAAEAAGSARRLEVASAAETSGQTQEQHQGGGRRDDGGDREERRPAPREEREKQTKGSAFEWLMESLR